MNESSSALQLELRVPAELARAVTDQVRRLVHDEVSAVLDAFHLHLSIELAVVPHEPGPRPAYGADAVVGLSANGTQMFLRDGELERIIAYALGSPVLPSLTEGGAGVWPDLLAAGDPAVGDVLAGLLRAALGPQLAEVLSWHPLRELLDIGVGLSGAPAAPPESPAAVEKLLAELPPPGFELAIHPDYLRELSADDRNDLFPFMWDGLFQELGLPQPPSRWRLDTSLRERGFQFRTAGITGVPFVGLELGTVLVNDTADRMALMGIDTVPAMNPATRQPAAIARADRKELLEEVGLTTWDPWGYLILCAASTIRENAWRFMTLAVADRMLGLLGRAFPEVVAAVHEVVPREVLSRVLRELLFDQVSIRDLRAICEALVRGWTDPNESNSDPVMLARHRQRFAIADKAGRGTPTVVVYLLDPKFESQDLTDPAEAAVLRDAVATEMATLPETVQRPLVLTLDARRRDVRHALRHRLPSTMVLGYGDIPPQWNIQPVARISPP
jgi:hypothetical protein